MELIGETQFNPAHWQRISKVTDHFDNSVAHQQLSFLCNNNKKTPEVLFLCPILLKFDFTWGQSCLTQPKWSLVAVNLSILLSKSPQSSLTSHLLPVTNPPRVWPFTPRAVYIAYFHCNAALCISSPLVCTSMMSYLKGACFPSASSRPSQNHPWGKRQNTSRCKKPTSQVNACVALGGYYPFLH